MERGHAPRFGRLDYRHGVRITDPVEEVQFDLFTTEAVDPVETDEAAVPWCFPVDRAARIPVSSVTVPFRVNVNVRDADGELITSSADASSAVVDERGTFTVEFAGTPVKLFLLAEGRVRVDRSVHSTEVSFPDADGLHLGARSLHERPARTLTTTRDPADVADVISEFGAALKTTSAERSFPTLRGHPPLVALGDELAIPGGRQRPDTGVAIEVPPDVGYLFPVAPLAYYLAADVRIGPSPRLVTDRGFEYPLDGDEGFERRTMRALEQVLTLDCLTRVEGYYPVELAEQRWAGQYPSLDLDYESLYDASLAEQVATYLSLPYADVSTVAPQWRLTATMPVSASYVDVLPHLAGELAFIRCEDAGERQSSGSDGSSDAVSAIDNFVRTNEGEDAVGDGAGTAHPGTELRVSQADVFPLDPADTATQTYIGDGFPLGGNKGTRASYERQLELRANAPTHIDVTVVCNDEDMLAEVGVGDHYGTRDLFEFDVDIRTELTRAELRTVFAADTDFVHYIGHVDQRGMQAADGYLDAESLDHVGATAFFLNGCRTFRQGSALVDAGAVAGIVTLENVENSLATAVGTNVARLVNAGWPLDGALELFTDDALVSSNYIVVGDGSVELITADGGIPEYAVIRPRGAEEFDVTVHTYPTRSHHLGSLYTPYLGDNAVRYLSSGELDTFTVTAAELRDYLSLATIPVLTPDRDGTAGPGLRWSDEIDVDEL